MALLTPVSVRTATGYVLPTMDLDLLSYTPQNFEFWAQNAVFGVVRHRTLTQFNHTLDYDFHPSAPVNPNFPYGMYRFVSHHVEPLITETGDVITVEIKWVRNADPTPFVHRDWLDIVFTADRIEVMPPSDTLPVDQADDPNPELPNGQVNAQVPAVHPNMAHLTPVSVRTATGYILPTMELNLLSYTPQNFEFWAQNAVFGVVRHRTVTQFNHTLDYDFHPSAPVNPNFPYGMYQFVSHHVEPLIAETGDHVITVVIEWVRNENPTPFAHRNWSEIVSSADRIVVRPPSDTLPVDQADDPNPELPNGQVNAQVPAVLPILNDAAMANGIMP